MAQASLEDLVRQCQRKKSGDISAFEQLVTLQKGRVFSLAYRLVGDWYEAEDVAQEVFLKVYRSIHTLEDPATFPAWIGRITANTCFDALNQRQRRPKTVSLTAGEGKEKPQVQYVDASTPVPEEVALRQEIRQCLERTLQEMEPDARAVIVLRDIEDLPYAEIAQSLSLGLSAVKMRIHRARVAFQSLLAAICPGVGGGASSTPAK